MTGRPPKVPYARLEALLRQLRAEGATYKSIARGLGYHYDHVAKLCKRFGVEQLKPFADLSQKGQVRYNGGQEGAPNGNVSAANLAATEAKPGDSR